MAISTNGTVIARLAGGLYNTVMSNATYLEVASQDPSTLANTLYARDFAKSTDLAVATTLLANLGLAGQAGLDAWVAAQLTAAGAANKGAKIVSLLNDFAGLASDATWGTYATSFNTKVDAALAASQKTGSVEAKFEAAGIVASTAATFTLTTSTDGLDKFTGGAGNDTFNATVATLNALDSIDGGAGTDSLVITDSGNILTQPATVTGIETLTVNSTAGAIGSSGVVEKVATKQDITYTFSTAYGTSIGTGPIAVTVGGQTITVGTTTGSYNTVEDVAAAISTLLGSTATVTGSNVSGTTYTGTINIKAATAGDKLPAISFANGSYTTPGSSSATGAGAGVDVTPNSYYSFPVTNVAYQEAAAEVAASTFAVPTGVTTATLTAASSLKASSVTTAATTVTGTDVTLSGGASQSITASDSVYASGSKGAIVITNSATPSTGFYVAATTSGTGTGIKSAWGTSTVPVAGTLVTGGSTVTVSGKGGVISSTSKNVSSTNTTAVQVGSAVNVSSAGSATGTETIRNSGMNPTGDVSITNQTTHTDANGLTNVLFSTGTTNVYTNGSSSVSVKGSGAVTIVDIGTQTLVPSTGAAAVAGTSKLTNVTLSGLSATSTHNITSDALSTVTVTDSPSAVVVNVLNSGTAGANSGAINLVVSNTGASGARMELSDATATSVSISTAGASAYQMVGGSSGTATNSGSKSFVTLTTPKATSITMTNALAIDIGTATSIGKVGTVNASGASGAVTTTIGSATEYGMIFTGGSGKDSVTLTGDVSVTSTTKATTVALGAGDDKLLNSSATTTFTGATFDGGEGNDTVAASLITVGNASKFTSFETLGLDKAHGTSTDITILGGTTGLSLLSAASGATATYTSVTQAKGLTVGTTTTGGTTVLDFGSTVAATTDAYTVTFAATGGTTAAAISTINAGVLSIEGIEAVTIASGGSGFAKNTIFLKDATARTLTITGDQAADVAFNTAFGADAVASTSSAGVSLIDASALTGKLTLNVGAVKTAFAGTTIKGGSNDDTITLAAETSASTATYTVNAGAGDDTIITVDEKSTLTGGAGKDYFNVTATKSGVSDATGLDSALRMTTITDFAAGDTIKMGTTTVTIAAKAFVTTATTLTSAIDLALKDASSNPDVEQNMAAWFVYGGDTYVVVEGDSTDGLSSNDMIVLLTGVTSDLAWTNSASGLIGIA